MRKEFAPVVLGGVVVTPPLLLGVVIAVTFGMVLTFFLWPTHPTVGTITATSWRHLTSLQQWSPHDTGDWCSRVWERAETPPVRGRGERAGIRVTGRRYRYYGQESYVCGSSVDANGHTHTRYCSRAEYRWYCDYETQRWAYVEATSRSGSGMETEWFHYTDMPDNRREVLTGEWTLTLRLQDRADPYVASMGSEELYLSVLRADEHRALVNLRPFGFVKSVEPFHWESL